MRLSILTIYNTAASPADEYDLDTIAGIAPGDVAGFVDSVGAELGSILGVPSVTARSMIGYHVDAGVVRCRPIGTGPSPTVAEAELRALAREVAMAISGRLREDAAREYAA